MELAGSADAPVLNPTLVSQGCGENEAVLKLNGADVTRGRRFRYGHRRTLDGTDLIVWIEAVSEKPVRISVSAGK